MRKHLFLSLTTFPIVASSALVTSNIGYNNQNSTVRSQTTNLKTSSPSNFDTAYRGGKIGFANLSQQFVHESKYNENPNAWQGPVFTDYWGRDYAYPYNAQQLMKDSSLTDFTLAFLNPLSNEDETGNLGAGYIDSFQEIHALGGNVTVSFGGWTPSENSFFNQDPSGDVMYQHLKALALGYNVSSFDFDIEANHTFSGNDAVACAQALAKLKSLLALYNRHLQVRFTEGGVDLDTVNTLTKYIGTDFIWNDMTWTALSSSLGGLNPTNVEAGIAHDAQILRQNPLFKKMSMTELYHHLGFTFKVHQWYTPTSDLLALSKWALSKQLGLVGVWKANEDHKVNSPLDPTESSNSPQKVDFHYTNTLAQNFGNLASYGQKPHQKPGEVKNVSIYAKSRQYISLKWDSSAGAQYYILEDAKGNVITKVKRCFAAISFREYPNMTVTGKHSFKVIAVNAAGQAAASKTISTVISKDLISGQIEYYDANINYQNYLDPVSKVNASMVKFIDYQSHIYQDINTTANGIKMNNPPNKDKKDWKLLGVDTESKFGLSAARIKDLHNFEWDKNINETAPLIYVNYKTGDNTTKKDPNINHFPIPIQPSSKIAFFDKN